jgi:hypothetical protein
MIRRFLGSKKFIIGISCLAFAFALIVLRFDFSSAGTSSYSPGHSISTASYTPSYAVNYSSSREDSLKEKVNRQIDRVIELIDEILE